MDSFISKGLISIVISHCRSGVQPGGALRFRFWTGYLYLCWQLERRFWTGYLYLCWQLERRTEAFSVIVSLDDMGLLEGPNGVMPETLEEWKYLLQTTLNKADEPASPLLYAWKRSGQWRL
ncbi:UNVERIFIED_CONTAM: hypothetical protein FKN15_059513 [Acipenser sinensis]